MKEEEKELLNYKFELDKKLLMFDHELKMQRLRLKNANTKRLEEFKFSAQERLEQQRRDSNKKDQR